MKISKIFLFTAAALALCGACDDSDDKVDPSTTEDKISISPTEGVVGSKGGDVSTMVTSSGEWTLEGAENAYVTPSAAKGKDGDIVAFTVKAKRQGGRPGLHLYVRVRQEDRSFQDYA